MFENGAWYKKSGSEGMKKKSDGFSDQLCNDSDFRGQEKRHSNNRSAITREGAQPNSVADYFIRKPRQVNESEQLQENEELSHEPVYVGPEKPEVRVRFTGGPSELPTEQTGLVEGSLKHDIYIDELAEKLGEEDSDGVPQTTLSFQLSRNKPFEQSPKDEEYGSSSQQTEPPSGSILEINDNEIEDSPTFSQPNQFDDFVNFVLTSEEGSNDFPGSSSNLFMLDGSPNINIYPELESAAANVSQETNDDEVMEEAPRTEDDDFVLIEGIEDEFDLEESEDDGKRQKVAKRGKGRRVAERGGKTKGLTISKPTGVGRKRSKSAHRKNQDSSISPDETPEKTVHPFFAKRKRAVDAENKAEKRSPSGTDSDQEPQFELEAWAANNATVHVGDTNMCSFGVPPTRKLRPLTVTIDQPSKIPSATEPFLTSISSSVIKIIRQQEGDQNFLDQSVSIGVTNKTQVIELDGVNKLETCTEKYKPKKQDQIPQDGARKLLSWLEGWHRKQDDFGQIVPLDLNTLAPVAILSGPVGCGKTAGVYAVANQLGFTVKEINSGTCRTGKRMMATLKELMQSESIQGADTIELNVLLLFEEVDNLSSDEKGFWSCLWSLADVKKRPILLTCNNRKMVERLFERKHTSISFDRVGFDDVRAILSRINRIEKLGLSENDVATVAGASRGDVRAAVNSLSYAAFALRDYVDTSVFQNQGLGTESATTIFGNQLILQNLSRSSNFLTTLSVLNSQFLIDDEDTIPAVDGILERTKRLTLSSLADLERNQLTSILELQRQIDLLSEDQRLRGRLKNSHLNLRSGKLENFAYKSLIP